MVELQSCGNLVNSSALCVIEQEVKGESTSVIDEISAELQRERQRNAELIERISVLEAQIQERDKDSLLANLQDICASARVKSFKKFKRQKIEPGNDKIVDKNRKMVSHMKHDTECMQPKNPNLENCLVNWMSMDDTQLLHFEKVKDGDFAADCDDTDECDYEYIDENVVGINHRDRENGDNIGDANELQEFLHKGINDGMSTKCLASSTCGQGETTFADMNQGTNEDQSKDGVPPKSMVLKEQDKKDSRMIGVHQILSNTFSSGLEVKGSGITSPQKKLSKLAFCPKEVKRIIESEVLLLKNAQSHTIRKIIVFASLGIRHGCEDMHELDFNHFSILRKGEPYVCPKNPGEHVLYDNPRVRRRVFYPNRQNPILCPVQLLEEEKAMRPSDASCPSCLFLCIKYGGRTRNLPQNEYVRQRTGRNKLKSFGPVMCRMAMLVHIRSGSFFFKALGITLLFMSGFPDDLVQKETKHRNLDLLQKYYRTDQDAEGEDLILPHPMNCDAAAPKSQQLTGKTLSAKSKGKKQTNSIIKPHNSQRTSIIQSAPSSSVVGYTSVQTHATATVQSMPSQTRVDTPPIPDPLITRTCPRISNNNQTSYAMFSPHPANAFVPMMYWPPPNAFPPCPYPSLYSYRSFPSVGNYISIHPPPHYNHSTCNPLIPETIDGTGTNNAASGEASSDSNSSSSSTNPKEA